MKWWIGVGPLICALLPGSAVPHSQDGYHGHDAALCKPASPRSTGALACTDPAANPCYSGQQCETINEHGDERCHGHGAWPAGKNETPACQAYRASQAVRDPPPPSDGTPNNQCTCCDGTQLGTDTTDFPAGSCQDQCDEWVRDLDPLPAACMVDDPPVTTRTPAVMQCECCAGVEVDQADGWTCKQSCDSLIRQQPDACPVGSVPPPDPTDPDPPPYVPGADQLGCHDNGPGMNDHHTGCPGPNVHPGHNCSSLDYHRHEDAWENECHNEDYAHDETGCGYGWHLHDGLECHDPDSGAHVHDRGHGGTAVTNPPAGAVTKPSPVESGKRCVCCDGMVIRGAAYADACEARCRSDMGRRGASCESEAEGDWRLLWTE